MLAPRQARVPSGDRNGWTSMTPTPAGTHAADSKLAFAATDRRRGIVAGAFARVLEPRVWSNLRLLVDVVVLYLATAAALFAARSIHLVASNQLLAAIFPLIVLTTLHARRSPDDRLPGSMVDTTAHVVGAVSLASMATIALDAIAESPDAVQIAVRLWLFAAVYLSLARAVLLSIRRQAVCSPALATPTLIVGAGVVGRHLVKRLLADPSYGLRPVAYLDSDPLPRLEPAPGEVVPVLGGPDDLAEAIQTTMARRVILAFSSEPDQVLVSKVRECDRLGIEVSLVPRLYESINERATLDHVGGLPLLTLRPTNPRGWEFAVKHAFDRGFALAALITFAPLMIACAIAVRLSSPGPVLFRQRRVGRDGHEFDVLKFRTMREPDDNGLEFHLPDGVAPGGIEGQDRRTRVGALLRDFSLDELPQLINVVKGDMSLVGPRPERPEYVQRFSRDVARYEDRHRVRSGITGWAQVHGLRGQTSIADRVEWDNYYIQNWSLRLDLRIVALTVAEVFRLRG
jgi:exopolysaccharide biosynthesis polyprenyl glycosylphosphotransferase